MMALFVKCCLVFSGGNVVRDTSLLLVCCPYCHLHYILWLQKIDCWMLLKLITHWLVSPEKLTVSSWNFYHTRILWQGSPVKFWKISGSGVQIQIWTADMDSASGPRSRCRRYALSECSCICLLLDICRLPSIKWKGLHSMNVQRELLLLYTLGIYFTLSVQYSRSDKNLIIRSLQK